MDYRLGFPVKVLGEPLRSHDSRRWQNSPHLSVSLAYVRDILIYLQRKEIRFYRLAGQLAPYLTHPDMPQFHRQIDDCATELAATGDMAREFGIRLTLHPGHYVQLNSPDVDRAGRSAHEVAAQASLLDALGLELNAVIVVHVGGRYGDVNAGRERFVRRFNALPKLCNSGSHWKTMTASTVCPMRCGFTGARGFDSCWIRCTIAVSIPRELN